MFVKVITKSELLQYVRIRKGEEKVGEKVHVPELNWKESLIQSPAKYVLFGIPEDIGVRANQGRGGAHTAWKPSLESFLNQQNNVFMDASEIMVLGEVVVDDLMLEADGKNIKNSNDLEFLREKVKDLDKRVVEVVKTIVGSGKIALIIGGGHNNAYGNIRGTSEALGEKINVLNCDPHLDFRSTEGRHSGNGFSYAFEEGYLSKYAVFCMHEQYNNKFALEKFRQFPEQLYFTTYEDVFVNRKLSYSRAVEQCLAFLGKGHFGLEVDIDAVTNVPSSAKTSSGISPVEVRQFVYSAAKERHCHYFHIAEAAPVLSHIKADNKTGKLIAYLLSDFIKASTERYRQ
jgi:formiminoglutamase